MADMGSGFCIKVTTEELRAEADTVSGLLGELQTRCEELYTRIIRTSAYWEGDSAEQRRKEYEKKQKTVERMLKRLSEYPEDLLEMAGVYEDAESVNTERMEPLSADVIL